MTNLSDEVRESVERLEAEFDPRVIGDDADPLTDVVGILREVAVERLDSAPSLPRWDKDRVASARSVIENQLRSMPAPDAAGRIDLSPEASLARAGGDPAATVDGKTVARLGWPEREER